MEKRLLPVLKVAGGTVTALQRSFVTKPHTAVDKKPAIWTLLVELFFQVT
jgi:hypothetical protein